MNDRETIINELMPVIGSEGCGVTCEETTVFQDDEGWEMMLEGFMASWKPGCTVTEAKASIREYAQMGFGLNRQQANRLTKCIVFCTMHFHASAD